MNAECPHRVRNVLYLLFALIGEVRGHLPANRPLDGVRNRNPARLGKSFEPRRDVHAVAVDCAVALLDDVAKVRADAKAHLPIFGRRVSGKGGQTALNGKRR